MAYVIPTAADFKARFPEFVPLPDGFVESVIAESAAGVTTRWREADYRPAIMLLTAHTLLAEGAVDRAAGKTSSMTTSGPITQKRVGEVSVSYAGAGNGSGGSSISADDRSTTEYGRRFLRLQRANFAGPMVA